MWQYSGDKIRLPIIRNQNDKSFWLNFTMTKNSIEKHSRLYFGNLLFITTNYFVELELFDMSSYETDKSWNPIDRQSEAITKIPNRVIIKRTSEQFELLLGVYPALRYLESIELDQHSDYGFWTFSVFGLRSLTLPPYIQCGLNSSSSGAVNNFFTIQNACSPWSPDILRTPHYIGTNTRWQMKK
jgi:hypothetical protein